MGLDAPAAVVVPATAATAPFYLTGEDHLRVTSWNAVAGVILAIEGTYADLDGCVKPVVETHTPNTDRTAKTSIITLEEGWLKTLHVRASAGAPLRGQAFVLIELVRGRIGNIQPIGTLAMGYVTSALRRAWPGSPLEMAIDGTGSPRTIVGTVPGAGAEIVETVPANTLWKLIAFSFQLTTSAVAGNRTPVLTIDDGANILYEVGTNVAQTLSQVARYRAANAISSFTYNALSYILPLPSELVLQAGGRVRTVTGGILGGDQYTAPIYHVEERIAL